MPDLEIPEKFTEVARGKSKDLAAAIAECVFRLGTDPRHQSLQTHHIKGTRNPKIFEAYVDMKNRVTWCYGEAGRIVLLNNCNHDIINRY